MDVAIKGSDVSLRIKLQERLISVVENASVKSLTLFDSVVYVPGCLWLFTGQWLFFYIPALVPRAQFYLEQIAYQF